MPNKPLTFQDAIDAVESLPDDQQENLIEVLRKRRVEQKREQLAQDIQSAREELKRGDVRTGKVSDLQKELSE